MNILRIELARRPFVHESGKPSLVTVVTPVLYVDGHPLFTDATPVLDTWDLLARSDFPGDFELLTCDCGIADCAGFHDPVVAAVEGALVRWNFPAPGYGPKLSPAFGNAPVELVFEHANVRAEQLRFRQALELAVKQDPLIRISPYDGSADTDYSKGSDGVTDIEVFNPAKRALNLGRLLERIDLHRRSTAEG